MRNDDVLEPMNTTDRNANAVILFVTIQVGINVPLLLEHTDQQFLVRQVKLLRVEIESAMAFTAVVHKPNRQSQRRQRHSRNNLSSAAIKRLVIKVSIAANSKW